MGWVVLVWDCSSTFSLSFLFYLEKKRVINLFWTSTLYDEIKINISAKSFLHSQVRIIVGTLYKLGDKTLEPNNIKYILEGKNRNLAGPTAPAEGLYLEKVEYPNDLLDDNWPIIYDRDQYN